MNDGLIIIPTYNEIDNISEIIDAVFALEKQFHILIVDDNSPDGTGNRVKQLQKQLERKLFLIERHKKDGLGKAYVAGFRWALEKRYRYIFEMDADFSHNPKDLIRLLDCCQEGNDIAIGSRYVKGVNVINWSLKRILLSCGASYYVRVITGMTIKDPTSGFICYTREALQKISLDNLKYAGYMFQVEMKYRAILKKLKVTEVSILFKDRTKGVSKLNSKIIWEAVFGVIRLRLFRSKLK